MSKKPAKTRLRNRDDKPARRRPAKPVRKKLVTTSAGALTAVRAYFDKFDTFRPVTIKKADHFMAQLFVAGFKLVRHRPDANIE